MGLEGDIGSKVSKMEEDGDADGLEALKLEKEQVEMDFEGAGKVQEAIDRLAKAKKDSEPGPEEASVVAEGVTLPSEVVEIDRAARDINVSLEAQVAAVESASTSLVGAESQEAAGEDLENQIKLIEDQLRESSDRLNSYRRGVEGLIISKGYEKRLNDLRDRINASREERARDMGENIANFKMRLDEAKKAIEKSPDGVKKRFALRDIEDLLTELDPFNAGTFYQYQQKYLSDGIVTITSAMSPEDVKRLFPHVENGNRNVDKLILDRSLVERERDEDVEIVELRSKIKTEEDTQRINFAKLEELKTKSVESTG